MSTSNYPKGFAGGLVLQEMPFVAVRPGNSYWVHSGTGSDDHRGTFNQPLATIDAAIGKCTANNGDVIYVKRGHSETVSSAGAINFDVAGVTLIGLPGNLSNDIPTVHWSGTAADIDINASSITIQGMVFHMETNTDEVANGIDVNATGFILRDCTIVMSGATNQSLAAITFASGAASSAFRIEDCSIFSPVAGANAAISLAGAPIAGRISGCHIAGDFANAAIHNPTGNVATFIEVFDNYIENTNAGSHAIEFVSAVTGEIVNNTLVADSPGAILDPGACDVGGNVLPGHDPMAFTGTADIDISAADYTSPQALLTIAPETEVQDCWVTFDLAKTTTGFAAGHAAQTIQFRVARKVDGTNWRTDIQSVTTATSGTNAAGAAATINVGPIGVTEQARVDVVLSAENGNDVELPYVAYVKAQTAPTFTAVAA